MKDKRQPTQRALAQRITKPTRQEIAEQLRHELDASEHGPEDEQQRVETLLRSVRIREAIRIVLSRP